METEGATCIDCHQNLVHKKVPEHDLNASLAQGKMVLKEEKKEKKSKTDPRFSMVPRALAAAGLGVRGYSSNSCPASFPLAGGCVRFAALPPTIRF